jgi:tetratricopeptide (TPR) repeat protein
MISLFLCIMALVPGCRRFEAYYHAGNYGDDARLGELFYLLGTEEYEVRYVLLNQVSSIYSNLGEENKKILFLTNYVETNPTDPYNALYLAMAAETYESLNALPMAIHYYQRIIKNFPDCVLDGNSVHANSLKKLIKNTEDNDFKIEYYKELISRYSDYLDDVGTIYYYLAQTYEKIGEWDQSIQSYRKFLNYPDSRVPGEPDAYKKTRDKVDFFYSERNWTMSDLNELVTLIRNALRTKDMETLRRLRAKTDFFTMYWEQKDYDEERAKFFNIGSFLLPSDVVVSDKLDIDSNTREAYLKTSGWQYWIETWYLYFRRISFPFDPEIDGNWEWAGIYFGEKL